MHSGIDTAIVRQMNRGRGRGRGGGEKKELAKSGERVRTNKTTTMGGVDKDELY